MGISLTLILNLGVSLLVSIRMYIYHGVLWIPDLFPSVQFRIQLRGLLCIFVLFCTNWWHLFEYALCNGNAREGWTNTFVLYDIIRSDALMVYLALMLTLTNWIRIRIRLEAVLIIYLVCYMSTEWFIKNIGADANDTSTYLQENYLKNILEANVDGMDLWTIHENTHTNYNIIITELTWWFMACFICIIYTIFAKLYNMFDLESKQFKSWRHMHHLHLCNNDDNSTVSRKSSIMPMNYPKPNLSMKMEPIFHRRHTGSQRTFSSQDINSLRFETKIHCKLCQMYGMVAPLDEYVVDHCWRMYVSQSSIWLLGYFCLCENYLLNINDYPLLLANIVLNRQVFRVYGFSIDESTISDEKVPISNDLFNGMSIFSTSIKKLR
ncbi:hypothetical protein THRCLA_05442 [Thraustotheca clavata]|uniref:Uncharacterized protein n=1 Tax=Thraustotheca clavata TaxID=74557 RepID=A0A1V9ZW14_9STRA|nr:hypothetical protein THRCLA_05442 [Thraustotheca clavata]